MKKTVKKLLLISSIAFVASFGIGCSNGESDDVLPVLPIIPGGLNNDESSTASLIVVPGLIFDFSNAKAIASTDDNSLLKILEDGTCQPAIVSNGQSFVHFSNSISIFKSPNKDSNDVFVVVDGHGGDPNFIGISAPYMMMDRISFGNFICIHENNTIADILYKTKTSFTGIKINEDLIGEVQFDSEGNVYYMATSTSDGYGIAVYKYNPKNDGITKLAESESGFYFCQFIISKDGQVIFVASENDEVRAIPVSNPNSYSVIYSSGGDYYDRLKTFLYDEVNGSIYVFTNGGLYKSVRRGNSFSAREYIGGGTSSIAPFHSREVYIGEWNKTKVLCYDKSGQSQYVPLVDENGKFIPENAVKYLVGSVTKHDNINSKNVYLSTDDIDIRFDKFKSIEGYESIYEATKGLKNADAIKALDVFNVRNLFAQVLSYNGYYYQSKEYINEYSKNLCADIFYVKNTDILLDESNAAIKGSSIKGNEFFRNERGNYASPYPEQLIYYSKYGTVSILGDNDKGSYIRDYGSFDFSEVLKNLFKHCYTHRKKEFRLGAFKNDAKYGFLYSELKDEKAIEWIVSDEERLFWFGNALFGEWDYRLNKYLPAYKWSDFLYIKDTDEPAWKESLISASYSDFEDWVIDSTGLWARYSNLNNSTSGDKYFYFVHIIDEDGCLLNDFQKVNLPQGRVSETKEVNGSLYMKYALLNSNGNESGFQQIYQVKFSDGFYKNLFENVANNKSLEVVSYSVGADMLYYSVVRGTAVENGTVRISTNEANPLAIKKKLSAIFAF